MTTAMATPGAATRCTRDSRPATAPLTTTRPKALRRLEEEQEAFEAFLQRLRTSKDKTEFDAMDDRARATAAQDAAEAEVKPETGARPGEY